MPQIPFCGPTYQGRSSNIDATRSVNFYLELTGTQDNKTMMALVGTPGLRLFATSMGTVPIRGMHVCNGVLYAVIDSNFYSIASNGALTALGSLSAGTNRVCITDNGTVQSGANIGGNEIIITDGVDGYIYNTSTGIFSTITARQDVTFQNTGDTVTLAGHSYFNQDPVSFSTITTTTGIVINTIYYVINRTTNTFQLSATVDGAALPLTNDGTGTISSGWADLMAGSYYPEFVAYLNGYFIIINGTMTFWVSDKYTGTRWNALAFGAASASSDPIVGIAVHNQQIFFLKTNTTEVWYDAGTPTSEGSPFVRQSSGVFPYGCVSKWTIARGGGAIFFLATQKMNNGGELVGVAMVVDYMPQIISTPAINYIISKSSSNANCFGYCYAEEGHIFYVMTNPESDGWTIVYDMSTNMWHERSSLVADSLSTKRHIGNCYAYFNGKHYVGDYRSSTIYEMSSDFYTDNGVDIVSFRTAQTIFDRDELQNVFIHMLEIDAETGVGSPVNPVANTPYPAGNDKVLQSRPTIVRTDIAATATGFSTVAGNFSLLVNGTKIIVTGFTNAAINTIYTIESTTTTTIKTTVAPAATEAAGNSVTLNNYGDVTILADGTVTASAFASGVVAPVAKLSWSNNGGHTWSSEYPKSMGEAGEYSKRLRWRRLGRSTQRVFKIMIKDGVKKIILGAYAEAGK